MPKPLESTEPNPRNVALAPTHASTGLGHAPLVQAPGVPPSAQPVTEFIHAEIGAMRSRLADLQQTLLAQVQRHKTFVQEQSLREELLRQQHPGHPGAAPLLAQGEPELTRWKTLRALASQQDTLREVIALCEAQCDHTRQEIALLCKELAAFQKKLI